MKRRLVGVFLAFCIAALFALSAQAREQENIVSYAVTGGNIRFRVDSGMVIGCEKSVTEANIPSQINGVSVTSIGENAFEECENLTSVTIPHSVTSIGRAAFYFCRGLSVTIPNSVTSIGDYAFRFCDSLTSVTIPTSVTSIGNGTFDSCDALTSVTIPDSVTSIGYSAFENCTNLTSAIIPNSVTSIGRAAFSGCSRLTSVTIPDGVTSIGDGAFANCQRLTNITVESGNSAYVSLNGILFSKNQKKLVAYPAGKRGAYNIPDSVTSLEDEAFLGCIWLTSVTIPDSITSIGNAVFWYSGLTSVTIPNSVTSIGRQAFQGCKSLKSLTIPDSVTSIGEGAFRSCDNLTSVTIPHSVTSIGIEAFRWCKSLISVTIPNSLTSIEDRAFEDCGSLKSVRIPKSVTSIGSLSFAYCDDLDDIYYAGTEEQWKKIDGHDTISTGMGAVVGVVIHYNSSGDTPDDDYIFIAAGSASNLVDSDDGLYREYAAVERGAVTTLRLREGITIPPVKNGVGALKVADGYGKPALSTIVSASFDSDDIIVSASACPEAYYARGIRRVNSEEVRVNTSQPDNTTLLDVAENVRFYFVDGDEIEEIDYDDIVNDTQDCVFYILADEHGNQFLIFSI